MDDTEQLLVKLSQSLESASAALPTKTHDESDVSLINLKTEVLVSYLQHLCYWIIVRVRGQDPKPDVVRKLVELRLVLEKGVRPLETRLQYQLDKVIRAADHADAKAATAKLDSASDDESDENSDDNLAFRPDSSVFLKPAESHPDPESRQNGLYKPPRITPVAPSKKPNKLVRSHAIEEYIEDELDNAPVSQANIGNNVTLGGRHVKSQSESRKEAEMRDYEEANYVRLPRDNKKARKRPLSTLDGEFLHLGAGEGRKKR